MKLVTRKITNTLYNKLKSEYNSNNMYRISFYEPHVYTYFPHNIPRTIINLLYPVLFNKYDNRRIQEYTPVRSLWCRYFRIRSIRNE
jgi:hypothetical protein